MSGYVWLKNGAWTELRVHGVSGTPPERILEHPVVRRVAGDQASGFFRRVWQAESVSADGPGDVLEAYSWGRLTSGGKLRVLWLLLLPFLLVNVAFYARPVDRPGRRQRFGEMVQRLFALTTTATLVVATANVSMDFAGWQCFRTHRNRCAPDWLGFLTWPWLDTPGRRVAVTALLPLAVIALLWRLAERTWCANEATPIVESPGPRRAAATSPPSSSRQRTPLENRHMWNSARPVRRLRAVHITAALALVGIFALSPFSDSGSRGVDTLLVAMVTIGLATVVLACLPSMSDRPGAEAPGPAPIERPADEWRSRAIALLPWATLALVAVALGWIAAVGQSHSPIADTLRGMTVAFRTIICAQAILLAAMAVVLLWMRRGQPVDPQTPPAWRGFATLGLMVFGSAMTTMYAAALVLAVAHVLGHPVSPVSARADPATPVSPNAAPPATGMITPPPYFWAAVLAVVIAVAAVGLGAWGWLVLRRGRTRAMIDEVAQTYGARSAQAGDRAHLIARSWARASLDSAFQRVAGWFVAVLLLLAVVFAIGPARRLHDAWLQPLASLGDTLIAAFALGLLYIGRRAYRDAGARRVVGVLWDLGTFWPRAAHPLAPPCYAERAVPELINRVEYLTRTDDVILSCHSQGSVLGVAVVNQLAPEQAERVTLLTYGAPLRRLYARFFPAYFGEPVLSNTASLLQGNGLDVPWRNLYRRSDPIGGAVFFTAPIDQLLVDPEFDRPAGDISYPPTFGHLYYPSDPQWAEVVAELKRLRSPAPPPSLPQRHASVPPIRTPM